MRKLVSICIALIIVVTSLVSPNLVLADEEGDLLSPIEENFILRLMNQIAEARTVLSGYKGAVNNPEQTLIDSMTPGADLNLPGPFEGCALPSSVPDTMSDIVGMWDTEVCNEFGYMSSKIDTFVESGPQLSVTRFIVDLDLIKTTVDKVDASITKIETIAIERVEELKRTRKAAKEAEREAKDDLNLNCFIATAAYSTPTAKKINILRQFRDDFMLESHFGNGLINFYYWSSPPFADFIARHEVLKIIVREGLIDPVVALVEWTRNWWQN